MPALAPALQPPPPSHDLEAASGPSASHEHAHHGPVHDEADLSSTAVVWDNELRQWRSQEEQAEEEERGSDATTVGGGTGAAMSEKRVTEDGMTMVGGTSGEEGEKGGVVWVEWEKDDPENPFNVSLHFFFRSSATSWSSCGTSCADA